MKNFFGYQNYIKFIKFAKNKYIFQHFRDLKKEKGIFLRHDVDLALEPAYKMSQIKTIVNRHYKKYPKLTIHPSINRIK